MKKILKILFRSNRCLRRLCFGILATAFVGWCGLGLIRRNCVHNDPVGGEMRRISSDTGDQSWTHVLADTAAESDIKPGASFVKTCMTVTSRYTVEPIRLKSSDVNLSAGIPRLLHRTWKDGNIPKQWEDGYYSCLFANPGYMFCQWTDAELMAFISTLYPGFLETYLGFPYPIQRVDAARYFLLYHFGGIYMDLDMACRLPFYQLLTRHRGFDVMLAEAEPAGVVGDFIISKPRHPFMRHVISGLSDRATIWRVLPYLDVMFSTGPGFLSQRFRSFEERDVRGENENDDVRNPSNDRGVILQAGDRDVTREASERDVTHRVEEPDVITRHGVYVMRTAEYRDEMFAHLPGSSWHCADGVAIWWIFKSRYRLALGGVLILFILFIVVHRRRLQMLAAILERILIGN